MVDAGVDEGLRPVDTGGIELMSHFSHWEFAPTSPMVRSLHFGRVFMKHMICKISVAAGMLTAATAAGAQENEATISAYAAGYKAAFTCSALFNAGKTVTQIEPHEFTGIYSLVQEQVSALKPKIDVRNKRVSVVYSDDMPPRISQWRPHLGCVQLPVGATADMIGYLPNVGEDVAKANARTDDGTPWEIRNGVDDPTTNTALNDVIARAFTRGEYGANARTSAVLIVTPESIIAEHYIDGFTPTTSQRTWSVAKSIAASVIGVAVEQGIVDVKAPARMPEWSRDLDPRKTITLENLLHMASGLDSNRAGNRTDRLYLGGGLVTDTSSRTALEATPGSRWKYANNDTLLAIRHLRTAMDDDAAYLAFPFKALLHKIGMTHTFLETDWDGNFILSSQVWTTSRDLARLGLLYLNDGVWNGERILPAGWANYVATPAPAQPPKRADGQPTTGYGAQWWLYQDFPGLPSDTYAARGNRGQILMIIPSKQLILVRRGYDLAGGPGFQMHDFAADVLKAMEAE